MAKAVAAEYGLVSPPLTAHTGSICTTRIPACAAHLAMATMSGISPKPQPAFVRTENRGISTPARRRRGLGPVFSGIDYQFGYDTASCHP
jgi:hypothetical protein